jgi:sulfide:quinone oxidoreductase
MARPNIVVVGGGVAALEAVIGLRELMGTDPFITLVAPNSDFVYQPMSVGEPFAMGPTPRLPLQKIADDFDLSWNQEALKSVGETRAINLEDGSFLTYDRLLVAIGAPRAAVYEHATTFRGETDVESVHGLVQDVEMGMARRIGFVVPSGVAWSLPLYELALMMARRAFEMQVEVELTLVTPEDKPLGVFGAKASAELEARLTEAGIRLIAHAVADVPEKGTIVVRPGGEQIECERIVALPVSHGPRVAGLTSDADGFIPIDSFGRVTRMQNVYAAGDGTNFPLKQGGLACQQADAATEHIASTLGTEIKPTPFRAVLRGQLLTGTKPQFMRRDVSARREGVEKSDDRPLWWPATKVAGKYLSAYLAESDMSSAGHEQVAPGVRRRAFLASAADDALEIPLRGYEYSGWASAN